MLKDERQARTDDDNSTKADVLPSALLLPNGLLAAVKIGKSDCNGVEIKVGDVIERIYKYEIRTKNGLPYAHILDGSIYHLSVKEIGRDFKVIKN